MSKKITKEELKSPDAFNRTMDQTFSFATRYGKPIAAVLILGLVVTLGILISNLLQDRSEDKAVAALYEPQRDYNKLQQQFEQAKAPDAPPAAKAADPTAAKPTPKPAPASGDLQKDYGPVVSGLQNVLKEHSGTVAAGQAAVYLATLYQEYGKLDEAKAALEQPLKNAKSDTLIHSVTHMVYGNVLAAQGNCKDAVASFEKVKNFLSVDASVKAGVCYEKLGQLDQAAAMYRKASTEADSSSSLAAKGYLRALEQKRASGQAG